MKRIFKKTITCFLLVMVGFALINSKGIVEAHLPLNPQFYGYGLMPYEDTNIDIKSKEVTFDLQADYLSRYNVIEQYQINANDNKKVKVCLPVIDNIEELVELKHNDNVISPQILYGASLSASIDHKSETVNNDINIDEEIKKVYPIDYRFDDSLTGYLYTVKNARSVSFELTNQKVLYTLKEKVEIIDGILTITTTSLTTDNEFSFFVINGEITPTDNKTDITKLEITYNDYFEQMYQELGRDIMNKGHFAGRFFKFLASSNQVNYFSIFDTVHTGLRLYVFEFDLLPGMNNINVMFPIQAATNQHYDPMKWIFNYQTHNNKWTNITDYQVNVKTNDKYPYLIDTNIKFDNVEYHEYSTNVRSDEISITVCEKSRPVRYILGEFGASAIGQYVLVGFILLLLIGFIGIIVIIIIRVIKKNRHKLKRNG